ncbi:hypothetical protein [Streptomyces sp. ITFR-6]|uniref:hypothetical protein n=1 Tax=Streptomyces sp. ITFR-6 TaxID=3075197 RepID=UPI002889A76C|nr:hypothetical protein [Streptomyces sp. ITFR-6]WNI34398.1 hypothetical protein RLT59_37910 [Streptomyces sp. ITFR-6]
MTGAQTIVLTGTLPLGLLTSLLLRKHRAALAFLRVRAVGEAAALGIVLGALTMLGAAIVFGTGPLLGGLDSLMASVVAVALP